MPRSARVMMTHTTAAQAQYRISAAIAYAPMCLTRLPPSFHSPASSPIRKVLAKGRKAHQSSPRLPCFFAIVNRPIARNT